MIRVYTDGACSTKTGIGGWSWLLVDDDELICGDLGRAHDTTSQRMELVAAGAALRFLPEWLDVEIVSDSAYLVSCFNDRWYAKWRTNGWKTGARKPVENRDLWELLLELYEGRTGKTTWTHVKGHNGDRWNEHCDRLAVHAREKRGVEGTHEL